RDRNVTGVQTCALPIYEDFRVGIAPVNHDVRARLAARTFLTIVRRQPFTKVRVTRRRQYVIVSGIKQIELNWHVGACNTDNADRDRKSKRLNSSHVSIS